MLENVLVIKKKSQNETFVMHINYLIVEMKWRSSQRTDLVTFSPTGFTLLSH